MASHIPLIISVLQSTCICDTVYTNVLNIYNFPSLSHLALSVASHLTNNRGHFYVLLNQNCNVKRNIYLNNRMQIVFYVLNILQYIHMNISITSLYMHKLLEMLL